MSLVVIGTLAVIGIGSLLVDTFGHDSSKPMQMKTAIGWTLFWVFMACVMGVCIYFEKGGEAVSQYAAGYLMEKSLSMDNLMVFMAIFSYFGIKSQSGMHKVMTYGILGAILFRGIFASVGTAMFHLHWSVQVLFGIIVIWSAKALIFDDEEDEEVDYGNTWYAKLIGKFYPYDSREDPQTFFTVDGTLKCVTSLLLCTITIELSDVMFSFDSVPAVIGVAKDPDIVYSAMMMAVLGLRALYFVIEVLIQKLHHLEKAVAIILVFVGGKLIAAPFGYEIAPMFSLVIVLGLLAMGVASSFMFPPKD